jgi:hypothetical protein
VRLYSCECIAAHAHQVQGKAFVASGPAVGGFFAFLAFGLDAWALACAFVAVAALGASAGAWFVAARFKD